LLTVCALGSQDGSLSFWCNGQPRAPLVIESLFNGAIYDIAWSPDGHYCAVGSAEGVVVIVCVRDVFGVALSRAESDLALDKYGGRPRVMASVYVPAESSDQARFEQSPIPETSEKGKQALERDPQY
jgi:hypothetical protein